MAIATGTALALGALGSLGGSVYSAKKQADQMKQASQLSPAGVAAQQGLTKQAGKLNTMGDRLLGQGTNDLERVAQYWRPLLSGDRAQVQQAIAPDVASVTDVYRGAERSLDRSPVRGAQKDQQAGELRRQKAGQISLMPMQQRNNAAGALGALGENYFSTGANAIGQAGNLFGQVYAGERQTANQGQAYSLAESGRQNEALQRGAASGFFSLLDYYKGRSGGSPLPALPTGGSGMVPFKPPVPMNRP